MFDEKSGAVFPCFGLLISCKALVRKPVAGRRTNAAATFVPCAVFLSIAPLKAGRSKNEKSTVMWQFQIDVGLIRHQQP